MKCTSTGARIILAYLLETWLRDQRHSTFTKLIRRAPNQKNHRDGHDDAAGIAMACIDRRCNRDGKVESSPPSTPSAQDAAANKTATSGDEQNRSPWRKRFLVPLLEHDPCSERAPVLWRDVGEFSKYVFDNGDIRENGRFVRCRIWIIISFVPLQLQLNKGA